MDNIYRAIKKEEINAGSIDEIRKEIENIGNVALIMKNFENDSLLHKKKFIKKQDNAEKLLKIKLLNSKIRERQEINEKLKILLYHLSLLKSTQLTKDYNAAKRCMHQFTTNDFTKISTVLRDINNFKSNIKELDKHYKELLTNYPLTLDYKLNIEFNYKNTLNNLFNINKKQKQITAALGKSFVKTAKELVKDEDYRDFVEGNKL